jgi:hypothetical protein
MRRVPFTGSVVMRAPPRARAARATRSRRPSPGRERPGVAGTGQRGHGAATSTGSARWSGAAVADDVDLVDLAAPDRLAHLLDARRVVGR